MARLIDMRVAVIARCSEFRPNQDFPIPDGLVDYEIFNAAGEVLHEYTTRKRTAIKVQPWMYTRFDCLVPKKDESECIIGSNCYTSYVLDMPFRPMEIEGAIGSVILQKSAKHLNYIPIQRISWLNYQEFSDFEKHPAFTIDGNKMYFIGRGKAREFPFHKTQIAIHGVVGTIVPDAATGCIDGNTNVPVPDGLRGKVIDMAVRKLMQGVMTDTADQIDDGNIKITK